MSLTPRTVPASFVPWVAKVKENGLTISASDGWAMSCFEKIQEHG
jgi:hypothetical protein